MSQHKPNQYLDSASEKAIQASICQWLDWKGIFYSVTDSSLYFVDGKPRQKVKTTGMPDLIVCWHGLFIGIEVKTRTGRLRPAQIECHKRIKKAGGIVIIARCLEDVQEGLK